MGHPTSDSVRSDAALQPQGTDAGQSTSFPSFSSSPTISFSPPASSIQHKTSRNPTPEQAEALAALKKHHNSDIIAWHTLSQSTEPDLRHRDRPGGLSAKELLAISILRECSCESLIRWLESSNRKSPPHPGLSNSRSAAAPLSCQIRSSLPYSATASGHLSPVDSSKGNAPQRCHHPHNAWTATQSCLDLGQASPTVTAYSTPAQQSNPIHRYWCTICENHGFQHGDGWKKHEKEHEIRYVCMHTGLFENTKKGRECVLCGALNQTTSHHSVHNIAPCREATNRPSFKRRYEMVAHLRDAHGVYDVATGGIIADKWRCESSKKAWSCGFCIHLSKSRQDHHKHVATEHFEKGQSIEDWKYSNVIHGLLLQPEINVAWTHLWKSGDRFIHSKPKWSKLGTEDLVHKLEKGLTGEETPQSLAKAAFESAEFDWSSSNDHNERSATTTYYVPHPHISTRFSPSCQDPPIESGDVSDEHQPWSPPPQQEDLNSSYNSKTLYPCAITAFNPSPSHLFPTIDQNSGWDFLTSDPDDMNSAQPMISLNDHTFCPTDLSLYKNWDGYNTSSGPANSDQERVHCSSDAESDWPTYPSSNDDGLNAGSTLKRSRNSTSQSAPTIPLDDAQEDRPRKKGCRKGLLNDETEARGYNVDDEQLQRDVGEHILGEVGVTRYLGSRLHE